jgi:hypothetical protein
MDQLKRLGGAEGDGDVPGGHLRIAQVDADERCCCDPGDSLGLQADRWNAGAGTAFDDAEFADESPPPSAGVCV